MTCVRSSRANARVGDPLEPAPSRTAAFVVAVALATAAFWAYTQTLLPGVDLGDTGGFQAAVLWPEVSARQAYPLYYGLARPFVSALSVINPARGLNLFSAVFGALAAGMLAFLCATITDSLMAGAAAGLLLAFSYTFWSQAIIAEVYTLHLALVLACCLSLYAYAARPRQARLAVFFGIYALAFGNHLSMILLFVPFTVFLLLVTPDRRSLFTTGTIAMAIAFAVAGALQYWPNLMSTSHVLTGPVPWRERLAAFWFDTTKADWRETMVFGVREDQLTGRLGMLWFDMRQQFGIIGVVLAAVGVVRLWATSRPWATLVILGYLINTTFAFTYNVGDTHVFYLPSHLFMAFAAGAALSGLTTHRSRSARALQVVGVVGVLVYAGWRGWDTWPAIDRHDDRRADALVTRLALGVNAQSGILVTDLNWQLENALLYYTRWQRHDVPWVRLAEVQLHFPFLVQDNQAVSRDVVMDRYAARDVVAAFGPLFDIQPDAISASPDLLEEIASLNPGTPYVLCVLTPPREERLDPRMMNAAVAMLTGNHSTAPLVGAYQVLAGIVGERPTLTRAQDTPFRQEFRLLDDPFTVRMESWLPSDTFRRAGFGHVIRGREHVLTVERGVSLVWFNRNTSASPAIYAASLYAPGGRYRIRSASPSLARDLH